MRKKLGEHVRDTRERLGFSSREALAEVADIGTRSVAAVERGEAAGRKVLNAVEEALNWPHGTISAFLKGEAELPPLPKRAPAPELAPRHEWSASERARMRDMSMAEVRDTHDMFRRKSEYLADVWIREVMRVKAEAEIEDQLTTDS